MRRLAGTLCLLLVALGSHAQQQIKDTLGTHVVEEGETLSSITLDYLGDSKMWRENWRLNPEVDNPDLLTPGQRLTVIVERQIEAESAAISTARNQVQKNLKRRDWIPASVGDYLEEQDGLRTLERSSAKLRFNDNSTLLLSEYSQIFLETKRTTLRGADEGKVELERGSAELVFEPIERRVRTDIELIAGNASARPEADLAGRARLRTERTDLGARFSVLEGSSTVTAGGKTVEVARGEGTVVTGDGPPADPVRLLASPEGVTPQSGAVWVAANQPLTWDAQSEATSYVVEICGDPQCAELLQKGTSTEARFEADLREAGEFFWRVRGVSSIGIEGFPSPVASLTLLSAATDSEPPTVGVLLVGAARRQARNAILIGGTTRLRLAAHDDVSGVNRIEYVDSSGAWTVWNQADLAIDEVSWPFQARATDNIGQVSSVYRLQLDR